MKPSNVGGQAVMEGIMMKHKEKYAVAVRKTNNEIIVDVKEYSGVAPWRTVYKIPFIRGMFAFADALVLGLRTLSFSAKFFEEEEEVPMTAAQEKREKLLQNIVMFFGVVLVLGLFIVVPFLFSSFFRNYIQSNVFFALIEGVIRLSILIGYISLVSKLSYIRRTYMYHGAEHKCINCIEQGLFLNLENVRNSSKEHKRCGTSFLFFVVVVSVFFGFFINYFAELQILRVMIRLLLLPLIAGTSYEIIRLAGQKDSWLVNLLSKPGMLMQKITTKEPDDSMIEVAIVAVEEVFDWREFQGRTLEGRENGMTLKEAYEYGARKLQELNIENNQQESFYLLEHVTGISRGKYYVNQHQEMSKKEQEDYMTLIHKRLERIPLQHVIGTTEFMGLPFKVNSHVLIPRQDTEILVETALEVIKGYHRKQTEGTELLKETGVYGEETKGYHGVDEHGQLLILDMCTGSGCILISTLYYASKYFPKIEGVGVDISKEALCVARENALLNGLSVAKENALLDSSADEENVTSKSLSATKITLIESDLFEQLGTVQLNHNEQLDNNEQLDYNEQLEDNVKLSNTAPLGNTKGLDTLSNTTGLDNIEEKAKKVDTKVKKIGYNRKYDMILSNPPYIPSKEIESLEEEVKHHDPLLALDGGEDGLFFYRQITKECHKYLNQDGTLIFECGWNQGEEVSQIMKDHGFTNVKMIKDLSGLDRVVVGNYG